MPVTQHAHTVINMINIAQQIKRLATLEVQRYRFIATEVYKPVNKLSPIYIQEFVETYLVYNLRDPIRTKVPKCWSEIPKILGNKIRNSLATNIKMYVPYN